MLQARSHKCNGYTVAAVHGKEMKPMFLRTYDDIVGNKSIDVFVSPLEGSVSIKSKARGYLFCCTPPLF